MCQVGELQRDRALLEELLVVGRQLGHHLLGLDTPEVLWDLPPETSNEDSKLQLVFGWLVDRGVSRGESRL